MREQPKTLLWAAALLWAWAIERMINHSPPYAPFWPAFIALTLGLGLGLAAHLNNRRPPRALWLVAGAAVLLSLVVIVRAEPLTLFLAFTLSLAGTVLFFLFFPDSNWMQWGSGRYLSGLLTLSLNVISAGVALDRQLPQQSANRRLLKSVLRGLLLAFPITLLFAFFLGQADPIFSRGMQSLQGILGPDLPLRLMLILLLAVVLRGLWMHGALATAGEPQDEKKWVDVLGAVEGLVVLGSLALLFGAFLLVQARYFFAGGSGILPDGLTYAEYARRGFGELLLVAFFTLTLLILLQRLTRYRDLRRGFLALSLIVVGETLVILYAALLRLQLYERFYGFTRLRLYTHWSLWWIGLLLLTVALLIWQDKLQYYPLLLLGAATGFALSLAVFNVDAQIVQRNVQRAAQGARLDAEYLTGLSADAVPALVAAYQQTEDAALKDQLGAVLVCLRANFSGEDMGNLARLRARELFASLALDDFHFNGMKVVAPSGFALFCAQWY